MYRPTDPWTALRAERPMEAFDVAAAANRPATRDDLLRFSVEFTSRGRAVCFLRTPCTGRGRFGGGARRGVSRGPRKEVGGREA